MSESTAPAAERRILVIVHTGRDAAVDAAFRAIEFLDRNGVVPVLESTTARELAERESARLPGALLVLEETCELRDVELAVVLGGDGTILHAAEVVRSANVPILGINLGHVGFLAESESDTLPDAMQRALARDYAVEERMTLDLTVWQGQQLLARDWALNDASIEKMNRARMLEVVIGVDGQPLSSFGCDGVIFSTPTGSTAYSFSAGGPIVWPGVDAMLMVPISAHALFARPIVVGTSSKLEVEIIPRTGSWGIMWCDGRRHVDVPPGARVEATTSAKPVRLARLHDAPFSKRLVDKFRLPIEGWRGPADA